MPGDRDPCGQAIGPVGETPGEVFWRGGIEVSPTPGGIPGLRDGGDRFAVESDRLRGDVPIGIEQAGDGGGG